MERKNMKKGMLRAAVVMALLGAAASPSESCAVAMDVSWNPPYFLFNYSGQFDFSNEASYKDIYRYRIDLDADTQKRSTFQVHLDNDFFADNVFPGRKAFTRVYHFEGNAISFKVNDGDAWGDLTPVGDGMRANRVITHEETPQNGVKLRNTQKHQVWLRPTGDFIFHGGYWSCDFYYIVDISDSHLDFEDSGITWKNGGTLYTLGSKFEFGTNGLSIDMDSLKINNQGDIKLDESMALLHDGGYYDYTTFYNKR